ncbi:iron-sulfur cluster biosynthesis family protein [Limosilactobacillus sp. STM2_1]|uniref:Iron-sulfur cluster biosynthesis family protein n=1 Tax=Limosilactobacillus rudii TaxID=2759755 RepID=A0A7W3UK44_9LACO|nr:iron-sulfur cluster biosynthesis family protein [Limosilactobacillus rudii]MBB1079112.1 iron-sulfur cluster biosynthesis family protein [Limosilactobacillus rudii]MBB1097013.1 iron-sulfur cluster biosynthesis family protein [Limosilactobacillus rudii]MCD7133981.1 iron-sulfur cluster biosynthesis family protein [Limosilactobacillus rudii]
MNITFTKEAINRLTRYDLSSKTMLLDFDDGVGPFSAVGSCSLDGGYRLILVNKDAEVPDYNERIQSNLGDLYIKRHTAVQFDDEMEVRFNPQYFTMPLVSPQRVLTDNLEVLDLSNDELNSHYNRAHDC